MIKIKHAVLWTTMALGFAVTSQASVTYTYTSPRFNDFSTTSSTGDFYPGNFFTTEDFLTFSFTVSDYIPWGDLQIQRDLTTIFNHTIGNSPVSASAWRISAGPVSFDQNSTGNLYLLADIQTDRFGNVYDWNINFFERTADFYSDGTTNTGVDSIFRSWGKVTTTSNDWAASCLGDKACLDARTYPIGSVKGLVGTWTITETSEVPLPAAGYLAASQLFALLGLSRWRRHSRKRAL